MIWIYSNKIAIFKKLLLVTNSNLKMGSKFEKKDSVVKIDLYLSNKIEEFIKKEDNRLMFVNKKQFIDLAVHEFLKKLNKESKTK